MTGKPKNYSATFAKFDDRPNEEDKETLEYALINFSIGSPDVSGFDRTVDDNEKEYTITYTEKSN